MQCKNYVAQCSLTWLSVKKRSFPCTESMVSNKLPTFKKKLGAINNVIEELDEVNLINTKQYPKSSHNRVSTVTQHWPSCQVYLCKS